MLKIQFKDGSGNPINLVSPGKTIGQGSANDIVIDQQGVNGFHADIQVDGNHVSISDINTASGTFVNGEKISGPTNLRNGDVITIDGIEFKQQEQCNYSLNKEEVDVIKWDDYPEWHIWLKDNGLEGIIKTVVSTNDATRKKVLTEYANEGKTLPSFIKETFFNTVKYSAAAIKKRLV